LKFIKKALKRHGRTEAVVTDGLRSYGAALKALNAKSRQAPVRRWKNNRAENVSVKANALCARFDGLLGRRPHG
jgi:transposase-like protein